MKNHRLCHLILLGFIFVMAACVSVKIPTGTGTPAKDVSYTEPASPFEEIKVASGDKTWLSSKTGNTISFLSECNANVDPTLQQLEGESLAILDKLKIEQTQGFDFNGRNALRTLAQGEVDGVAVKTELVVFKKNGCNFTLSFGGVARTFDSEKSHFDKFVESFKAM